MRRISRRALHLALTGVALAVVTVLPRAADAQQQPLDRRVTLGADGEPDRSPRTAKQRARGFKAFGLADAAVAAIKTPGIFGYPLCTYGFSVGGSLDCGNSWGFVTIGEADNSYTFINWGWSAPPSERAKIIAATSAAGSPATGLASSLNNGWTYIGADALNASDVMLPADGFLGTYMSGEDTERDRSCQDLYDESALVFGAGQPMLPASDCPETWGPFGWQGRKPVSQADALAALRAGTLPPEQAFDFWRYTTGEPDPTPGKLERQFGAYQTYGYFNDYSKDELCGTPTTRTYGRVLAGTPGGAQCPTSVLGANPTKPGYPLGLEVRFDAFSYAIPALQDVVFYQATVVNNSQLVYGAPIDYDSLYIGPLPTPYSDTQLNLTYHRPELGALIHTGTCAHQTAPFCNGAQTTADLRTSGVISQDLGGSAYGPFGLGSAAFIMLKSPIGDLRNKLYTRTGSPFADIPVPETIKDDTITFQHAHLCGFRACARNTFAVDYNQNPDAAQRMFGMMSSTDVNVLGVRQPSALGGSVAGQILWHTFRSADFPAAPAVGPGPGDFPQTGGFNRWVPGTWDWNDDGIQDTLYYDTCSGKTGGNGPGSLRTACVGLFSDTMPHTGDATRRWINGYSNTAGIMTVGPIKLAAGDTTSFVFAHATACCDNQADSLAIMAKVNAAVDHYMNFYLGPEPLPKDSIVAVDVVGGNQSVSRVTLSFTQTAEASRDPFLVAQAGRYAAALDGTAENRLAVLNPFLVDSLLAYGLGFGEDTITAIDPVTSDTSLVSGIGNFAALYVYKSCDGGATFTDNANCTPSPATGGKFAAVGWLPYATLNREADGELPNSFTDDNVNGGITYTYVLIGETRGASFTLQTGDEVEEITLGDGSTRAVCTANCLTRNVLFAPQLLNPLSTSGTNVATVYVPASLQAGGAGPLVSVTTVKGPVGPERVTVSPAALMPRPGQYDLSFYDSVGVTIVDSLDADGRVRLATVSTVQGYRNDALASNYVPDSSVGGIGLSGGEVAESSIVPGNGALSRIRTVRYVFLELTGVLATPGNKPVLVTSTLSGNATPEAFYSSSAFPGFRLGFAETAELAFNTSFGQQFIGPDGRPISDLTKPFVQLRTNVTVQSGASEGGLYEITWTDRPFGPAEPFRLDLVTPARTDSAVDASLAARAVGTTGLVTPEAAAAIGSGTAPEDLVPVKVPFTIVNTSFRTGTGTTTPRAVQVAMKRRASNSILFGTGADTVTVTVAEDQWVPGDQLFLLEDVGAEDGALAVTFGPFILGCDVGAATGTRLSCNPVALLTRGSTNYISTRPNTKQQVLYNPVLTSDQQFTVTVAAQRTGTQLAAACAQTVNGSANPGFDADVCADVKRSIKNVKVVPNPYVAISQYTDAVLAGQTGASRPLIFQGVPPQGVIRIYTVSGQLVQQLSWTPADLGGDNGDLQYNLRTREGLELAGGLYLFMVTGKDVNGKELGQHMGKFVVIR
jgi:hypothetical protein